MDRSQRFSSSVSLFLEMALPSAGGQSKVKEEAEEEAETRGIAIAIANAKEAQYL